MRFKRERNARGGYTRRPQPIKRCEHWKRESFQDAYGIWYWKCLACHHVEMDWERNQNNADHRKQ